MAGILHHRVERRLSRRFPLECDLRYRATLDRTLRSGAGRTVNISSSGILFTTDLILPPGCKVAADISWPVRLNDSIPLKLVALGRIVRIEAGRAVLHIDRYEFRTRRLATE